MLVYLLTCEGEIRPLRSIWDGGGFGLTYANLSEEVLGSSVKERRKIIRNLIKKIESYHPP